MIYLKLQNHKTKRSHFIFIASWIMNLYHSLYCGKPTAVKTSMILAAILKVLYCVHSCATVVDHFELKNGTILGQISSHSLSPP